MNNLGLATIAGQVRNDPKLLDASWEIGFMSIILFLVASFVVFSLAFILVARFVILLLLIIIAPIGFASVAIPQLRSTASKYWHTLFEQTLTAPVLLLLLYIALRVILDPAFLGGNRNYTGFVSGDWAGFANAMLSFIVAMGLLLAVVMVSKKLSAAGTAGASKLAGKLTFGATAWAGRNTAGFVSNYAARKVRGTRIASIPIVGRTLVGALDKGAKASFDIRGSKTVSKVMGAMSIAPGEAQKGGYKKTLDEAVSARTDYAKTLTGRGQTGAERAEVTEAKKKKEEATKEEAQARLARDAAKQEHDHNKAELARIEEERSKDKYWDASNPGKYDAARQSFAQSETAATAAENRLTTAVNALADATKKEAALEATIKQTTSAPAAQKAYAENITWGPANLLARNSDAAKKILKYADKSDDQRQIDALLAAIQKAQAPNPPPQTSGGQATT